MSKLHLLMNLCYGSPAYTGNQDFNRSIVARLRLYSSEKQHTYDLRAGVDLREWVFGSSNAINNVQDHVNLVWRAHHRTSKVDAVIDDLVLELPYEWREIKLDYIGIEDRSQELLGYIDPGIMIFGVAIEYIE